MHIEESEILHGKLNGEDRETGIRDLCAQL